MTPSKRVVFARFIRTRKGRVLDAHDYGLQAFRFEVDDARSTPDKQR
jgi:hypothetical protein